MSCCRLTAPLLVFFFSMIAKGDDLWLTADQEFPGRLRLSEGGTEPRVVFTRSDRPNPAYPNANMKASQIAISVDGDVYYCSGLDGSLMHLLDGRHEIQVAEVAGQIRDLACTNESHTVYYSVVPTPQDGQPLADGVIYRRDFWQGTPEVVAHIPQAQVGGNWWGTFTIRNGEIFLATIDSPSKLYRWSGSNLAPVYLHNTSDVRGLSVSSDNRFLFTNGSGVVFESEDFLSVNSVLQTPLPLKDVSSRALSTSIRP